MNTLDKVVEMANSKLGVLNKGFGRALVYSMIAGFFVGVGVGVMSVAGSIAHAGGSPYYKFFMAATFSVALALVLAAGADLFTGNNMVFSIAYLKKAIKGRDVLKMWGVSYLGNLLGSLLISLLFIGSGITLGTTGEFMVSLAEGKMSLPLEQMFFRAILCNILVCLGVWCYIKLQEESAKLIMVFLCIFTFVLMGFEHSVANMTLLTTAYLIPHTAGVTLGGLLYNLAVVTIGNIIGGGFFVGAAYYYVLRD
ncbi:MAG: formate/nitrite transporter family protein [Clostridiaceae bacterium]